MTSQSQKLSLDEIAQQFATPQKEYSPVPIWWWSGDQLERSRLRWQMEQLIAGGNEWVRLVPNTKEASVRELSPARVSGRLDIAVGRLRKAAMGGEYVSLFTVGDQLLWGAAEPLRRMLRILLARSGAVAASRAACA